MQNYTSSCLNHVTSSSNTRHSSRRRYVDGLPKSAPGLTISKFIKGAKNFRSALIDSVRKSAVEIFSIDSVTKLQCYSANHDRSQIPEIVNLLKNPNKPDSEYALHPRVLFTNYEVVELELFGSSALLKAGLSCFVDFNCCLWSPQQILKVVLLGQSSLDPSFARRPGPKGYAHQWEMTSVTPGCIAMAAVVVSGPTCSNCLMGLTISMQAQFILSPDPVFSEKGTISKIKYSDRFKQYKKFIIEHLKTRRMKELFAWYNRELFPANSTDCPPSPSSAEGQGASDAEDNFSNAFKNSDIQSTFVSTFVLAITTNNPPR